MSLPVSEPDDEAAVPYRGEQPYGVPEDLVILGVLDLDDDERLWVPQVPRTSTSARYCSRPARASSSTF